MDWSFVAADKTQTQVSNQVLKLECVFYSLKSLFLDITLAHSVKLHIFIRRCGFMWFSVIVKWLFSSSITGYLIVPIYHVPHVCQLLISTNPLLFDYPNRITITNCGTIHYALSHALFLVSLCFQVLCFYDFVSFKIDKDISAVSRRLPIAKARVKSRCNPHS
jgi:hypothetical protein